LTEAQQAAETAIELNPYDGEAYRMLAFSLLDQSQIDAAYEAALEALRVSPKSGTAHYVLGLILLERGDTAQAVHELETFLELYWDQAYTRGYRENAEALLAKLKSSP
jgi:tetratricopeptide (TPR) repeat protein